VKFSISNSSNLDMKQMKPLLKSFVPFAQKKMGFDRPVRINFASDHQNAVNPLGKTAFYDPNVSEVTIFTDQRHPKDVLRSLAHELVHHTQNCRGKFDKKPEMGEDYFQYNSYMREMEREAYEKGNMCFRDWEEKYRNQLQESIYYKTGDTKMNHKDWKNQATFGRLMESFGYEAPEEEEESEEVVEEGDDLEESFGKGEPVTARTFEPGKWGATSFKKTGRMHADVPAEPGKLQKDEPDEESFSSRTKARMSARTRASVSGKRGPRGLEEEGCAGPAGGHEDADVYMGLAESQVRELVRKALKKVFKK
jgi:hypothetical protein